MNRLILAALAALVLAVPAFGAAPRTISYQGLLTQPNGTPVADGNYALTVSLYDVASGGSALWTESHATVAVVQGGFNVILGSVTPLAIAFDRPLWLGLQVGADPEMSPRVALASSPYALGLSLPFAAVENSASPLLSLRNTGTGPAVLADGLVHVGSSTTSGQLELRAAGFAPALATLRPYLGFSGPLGGQVAVNDEAGLPVVRMEPDFAGSGGFFYVDGGAGGTGFTVDGSFVSGNPYVGIEGVSRSAVFDMSASGDDAVQLPSSAISALEQWNEPGVARVYANSAVTVGTGITNITSRSITVPDDGFLIVTANGHFEYGHVNGADSRCLFSVNDQAGVFSSQIDATGLPASAPTGIYRASASMTGVWPVLTAGTYTFTLMAQRIGAADGAVLNDPSITILYVPTGYGTVTSSLTAGDVTSERPAGPASESEMAAERDEARRFGEARVQRELDTLQRQLDALRARLGHDAQAAAAAKP